MGGKDQQTTKQISLQNLAFFLNFEKLSSELDKNVINDIFFLPLLIYLSFKQDTKMFL